MRVGPFLSQEQHDAIQETRDRRKQVAQQGASKRSGQSSQQSGGKSDTPQQKG